MGLFRSKNETYGGDQPLRGLLGVLYWMKERRELDFAQARRQADMLGIAEDLDRVVALIADISRIKPGNPRSSIGFVRQPS
ncbi:MAG: hypothetical protein ACREC3_11740 [Methyloceanibacter sp.]